MWLKGSSDELFVVIHGYSSSPEDMSSLVSIVDEKYEHSILIPEYDASLLSTTDPNCIVRDILLRIDELYKEKKFEKITLIGHSLGALLARKLYVCANCQKKEISFETTFANLENSGEWSPKVKNIVLLAALNRGWMITEKMSIQNMFKFKPAELVYSLLIPFERWTGKPLIFSIRRGAPFITQLRLQWLEMKRLKPSSVSVTQLLGSIDDLVSPEDNLDLVTGEDFVYHDVPHTNHNNILEMIGQSEECSERARLLRNAIAYSGKDKQKETTADNDSIKPDPVVPGVTIGDYDPIKADPNVTDVVFVIHGIRDFGYWTQKIARRIKLLSKEVKSLPDKTETSCEEQTNSKRKIIMKTETSAYGYFPMLSFILPAQRRAKVEWLMDQYTENKALYPNANFHYVGHSNGTYLLAKALQLYPACKFCNVVFAGSVVRRSYPWDRIRQNGQIQSLLNFVATGDAVVAFFPKLFQVLRIQDLGSAGHDGFNSIEKNSNNKEAGTNVNKNKSQFLFLDKEANLTEIRFITGGHGAALNEDNWDAIANFILSGSLSEKDLDQSLINKKQNRLIAAIGAAPYLVWIVILALLFYMGSWLMPSIAIAEWIRGLMFALFLWLIWTILTRV